MTWTVTSTSKSLNKELVGTTNEDMIKIMESVDTDKNGKINYSEFIAATMDNRLIKNSFSIDRAFKFFDRDHNGHIEKDELQQILQGSELNHVETSIIKDILMECDQNNDGVIDRDEFFRCMSYSKPEFKGLHKIPSHKLEAKDVIKEDENENME